MEGVRAAYVNVINAVEGNGVASAVSVKVKVTVRARVLG